MGMRAVIGTIDQVNTVIRWVIAGMLALLAVLVIVQIASRFVLPFSIHWTDEVARYAMIYVTFLGAALALRHARLIAIELLPESLPFRARTILKLTTLVLSMGFFLVLIVQGWAMVGSVAGQTSAAAQFSMGIPYAAIPIGAMLLLMNSVALILELVLALRAGEEAS